jgi:hypothetical protein
LDPRLPQAVGIQVVRFDGWSELYRDASNKAHLYLNGSGSEEIIAVIALLDLYGPTFYPKGQQSVEERYRWGVNESQNKVNDRRFRAYFAVYELEAWLLSNPGLFLQEVADKFPSGVREPERVNFDTPPAKLLEHLYFQHLKRHYGRAVDGKALFQQLDPALVYDKCPYFKTMMDEMLDLAR